MNRRAIAISSLLLAGCAHTGETPLIFGQTNTLGLSIGGSAPDQGGDLVLGYKSQNLALVPVTVTQPGGGSEPIRAKVQNDYYDAYSVLGQFEVKGKGGGAGQKAGLGTFFATGLAAKRLADGFAQKMGEGNVDPSCSPEQEPAALTEEQLKALSQQASVRAALQELATRQAAESERLKQQVAVQQGQLEEQKQQLQRLQAQVKPAASTATAESKPNSVLMYAQYQSLGFTASAAGTQMGADMTLGYKDRNFAIIPSMMRDPNGVATPLAGRAATDYDSLSVLGQFDFKADNEGGVNVGLGKFFSTGMAAKKLGDGFAAKLCGEYLAEKKAGTQPQGQGQGEAKKTK